MEEEKPHALEMGKEEKEAHEEKAEEARRRALTPYFLIFILVPGQDEPSLCR
jgi:hypothetical protein